MNPSRILVAATPGLVLLAAAVPTRFDAALIVLVVALALVFRDPDRARGRSAIDHALVAVVIAYSLASLSGIHPVRSMVLGYPLALGVLVYLVASRGLSDHRSIRRAALGLAASAAIIIGWTLICAAPGVSPVDRLQAASNLLLVVPNDAILLAVIATFVLPLVFDRSRRVQLLGGVVVLGSAMIGFTLESRGLLLALGVGLSMWALVLARRAPLTGVMLVLMTGSIALVDFAIDGPFRSKFGGWWDNRLVLWQSAWRQFGDSPILGQGPGSFGLLHEAAAAVDAAAPIDPRVMPWPHNLMLEILAGGGVVLAVAWIVLWSAGLLKAFHAGPGVSVGKRACGFALIVLAVAATYEASLLRVWFTLLFFSLMGMLHALETRHRALPGDPTLDHNRRPPDPPCPFRAHRSRP